MESCGVVVGVWDSYVGNCGVVQWLVPGTPMRVTVV